MEVEIGDANKSISSVSSDQVSMDTMRIFVGGLGEGVTDDDLRRMFVALGSVDEIEIIRSKGRSMAYLNYTPSSAKSLAKLFSSFNGCVWKGGKLRIEKAKEHYLVKMERELEKEEEIARNDALMKRTAEVVTLKKPTKGPGAEKEQIRIFFPKLRKVKPLPFSGCGKHKYSFRNIPVPPLPTHFCDCELHYVPYDAPIETGGVNEKEFDLMHSVLNKVISKDEGTGSNGIGGPSSASDGILASDKNGADSEPDEDGIIINISGAMKEPDFSWKSEDYCFSEYQGSNDSHPQTFKVDDKRQLNSNKKQKLDGSYETVNQSLKKKKDDLNAASALPLGSNSLRTKNSKWKELVGMDSSFKLSNVLSRGAVQKSVQQQEDTKDKSSKSEDPDDQTEPSADESVHDTEEDLSNSEETDNEAEDPSGESGKSDSEEESNKSEEPADEVEEESSGEFAKQDDAEEESSKSEEYDELAEQEDAEDESNKLEESDDELEQESSDDLAEQEDNEDESNDEVEQEASDDLANQEDTENELDVSYDVAEESSDELAEQEDTEQASNKLEHPVTKHGDNIQLEDVKLTDIVDGSVKKGATWSQVMPWTQLVSDLEYSSFSISQILPRSSPNQVAVKPSHELKDGSTHQSSKAVKVNTAPASDVHLMNTTTDLREQKNLSNSVPQNSAYEAAESEIEKPTIPVDSASKPVVRADTYVSRPFMRSAASLKEWAKLKENLRKSGTKKRKTPEE